MYKINPHFGQNLHFSKSCGVCYSKPGLWAPHRHLISKSGVEVLINTHQWTFLYIKKNVNRFRGWGPGQLSKERRCSWPHSFRKLSSLNCLIDLNECSTKSCKLMFLLYRYNNFAPIPTHFGTTQLFVRTFDLEIGILKDMRLTRTHADSTMRLLHNLRVRSNCSQNHSK